MRFTWDDFELDVAARRLRRSGEDVHCEPQVFDVLSLLIEQRDQVMSKEDILDHVWGDQFVSESALTTRIKEARRAIGDDGRSQKYIRNVHGHGYQFIGVVDFAQPTSPLPDSQAQLEPVRLRLALEITVDDEFPFAGRSAELEGVEDFLGSTSAARQVFIGGAPGVGKSRLAVELLERATLRNQLVCAGRCEAAGDSPLQPLRDAFAQLASIRPDRVADWCAGVEGPLLSLIPSLTSHLPQTPVPVDVYAGVDVLITVFSRVVLDAPLVLLIDDFQWSDEPTRGCIARLHRRLANQQVVTAFTFRSARPDLPIDVESWIRTHSRTTASHRIELGDLDDAAANDLVTSVLGSEQGEIASLIEATAGNCLFLTESIRDLQLGHAAAGSVAEIVAARLSRQSSDVQAMISAGALLGHEFRFSTAATASGLDQATALDAIDAAVNAELLHETASPARFRFSHQLVPESIAGNMGRRQRALIHAACADAIRAEGGDEIDRAFHVLGSVPLVPIDDAISVGRASAELAIDDNQFDRAIRLLQRVLELGVEPRVRAEVLLQIGGAIVARGTTSEAVEIFEDAAELGRRNGWPDVLADAALGHWGRSPFRRLSDRTTVELLLEADAAVGPEPSLRKALVRAKLAAFSLFSHSLSERSTQVSAALKMAPEATGVDRLALLEFQAVVFSCPAGIDTLDSIDPQLDSLRKEQQYYFADAAAPETRLLMRGLGAELRESADVAVARIQAQPISEWRDAVLRSTLAAFAGDLDEARHLCDLGGAVGEPYWGESTYALHALGLLFIDSLAGDWTRSREALRLLVTGRKAQVLLPSLAWALAASGDHDAARDTVAMLRVARVARFGEHILGGNALIALGEAALLLDDDDLAQQAEEHLTPFEDLVLGVPWACSFAAADTLRRLAERRGDQPASAAHLDRARRLYTTLDAPSLLERLP